MGTWFFAIRIYFACYFAFITGSKGKYAIAFRHLIHRKTHRIPRGSHKSMKTAASILVRRVYTDIFKSGKVEFNSGGDVCFYNDSTEPWALDYVRQNAGDYKLAAYLSPHNIYLNENVISKLGYLLAMLLIKIAALPLLIIRPVGIWALHFTILHEHVKILSLIKSREIKHFYDFFSYEIGSSFLTILLEKKGIRDYFITSPTPLYETYPDCVCDIFLSTSPYHMDEIEHLKTHKEYPLRFKFNELRSWPYNEFNDQLELNTGEQYNNQKKIGVYASGVWWRSKEKHQEFADGFFESEFLLLQHMKQFAQLHPEFEIWLFLHPRERRTQAQLDEGLEFYRSVFGEVPFKLMDFSKPTKSQFSACDISISVSSNTTYERLYGGFKSIFTPYFLPKFPIKGNALENICVRDFESLEKTILKFDAISTDAFFDQTELKIYHHQFRKFGNQAILKNQNKN